MKVLATVWGVFVNLIELVVIVAVLNAGQSQGQALVVTILVLIYLHLMTGIRGIGTVQLEMHVPVAVRVALLMKRAQGFGDLEAERAEEEATNEAIASMQTNLWIDAGFRSVEWLIAFWYLVRAL